MFQVALEIIRQNESAIIRSREEGETMVTLSQYTQKIYEGDLDTSDKVCFTSFGPTLSIDIYRQLASFLVQELRVDVHK